MDSADCGAEGLMVGAGVCGTELSIWIDVEDEDCGLIVGVEVVNERRRSEESDESLE